MTTAYVSLDPSYPPILGIDPVTWIVIAGVVGGVGYMVITAALPDLAIWPGGIYWILGIGLALRLLMMAPEPILEIDYYRYLWDGAVVNAGYSPYDWSPRQVMAGTAPEPLTRLAEDGSAVVGRINYPHLTTIYPPAAELVFAASQWIKPWDLTVWRLVILAFEIVTVALLFGVLAHVGRSPLWIIVYWWNPIVIFEFSNAAHMDAILLPFLLGALLFALKNRFAVAAMVCLAVATAVKLWPVLLLPTFIRSIARRPTAVIAALVFTVMTIGLLWPFMAAAFDGDAGLRAYGVSWQRNAALFHVLLGWLRGFLDSIGYFNLDAGRILRTGMGAVVILIALGLNRRPAADPEALVRRLIIVVAALLLLGPTLYPWYYTWMVPFLAIVPSRALLALTVVLPLYRLQFHPWFQDHSWVFTDVVVWAEQGPIFVLLLLAWRDQRRSGA